MQFQNSDLVIDSQKFNYVINKMRSFFQKKGFIECHTSNRLDVIKSCEDPSTLSIFEIGGKTYPMAQTQQMNLEYEIMNRPDVPGYFTVSTSYRNEANPIKGRHMLAFPLFEWESHGGLNELVDIECELLKDFGYPEPVRVNYLDMCEKYDVDEISHAEEKRLYEDYGSAVLLMNFPRSTNPFWNMKENDDKETFSKVDVILSGAETFGSAEREIDPDVMRKNFYEVSEGQYSKILNKTFGEDRVSDELENYLMLKFIPRNGAGCGMSRFINSLERENLMPKFD